MLRESFILICLEKSRLDEYKNNNDDNNSKNDHHNNNDKCGFSYSQKLPSESFESSIAFEIRANTYESSISQLL